MRIRTTAALLALTASLAGAQEPAPAQTLLEARRGFKTKLTRQDRDEEQLEAPPPSLFSIARYRGPAGELTALVSKPAEPGRKAPAIVWITGGFPPGGIGSSAWRPANEDNEQSAQAYRHAGLVMIYPTLRGSFGNPGVQEAFLGEVDDVLAAIEHARTLEHVDPQRIYLGGHSTGGTLALLVAAATDRVKAVFSFGPVDDPATYGADELPYDASDARESRMRAPIHFLSAIRVPTFVIEGNQRGNAESLRAMEAACKNPLVRFLELPDANHFDLLGPSNAVIARKLVEGGPLTLDRQELVDAIQQQRVRAREADDLETLAGLRRRGVDLATPQRLRAYLLSRERRALQTAAAQAKQAGLAPAELEAREDDDGRAYFLLVLTKEVTLGDLDAVFLASRAAAAFARANGAQYDGWDVE